MAKSKSRTVFFCSHCGAQSPKWVGRCPVCGEWNTYTEEVVEREPKQSLWKQDSAIPASEKVKSKAILVKEIQNRPISRLDMGDAELNRVLGGGLVPGSFVLVGGEPGIGKSTLMLQVALQMPGEHKILYVSGEESAEQLKMRADRLGLTQSPCYILTETCLDDIFAQAAPLQPEILVADSIQTLQASTIDASAGSISQIKECAAQLQRYAKETGTSVFVIGHITKDGSIAGPKIVEHMVDTVLYFESAETGLRLLRASKNRFGSVDEIGLFTMDGTGLHGVKDPASVFVSLRGNGTLPSGVAFTPVVEGSRTFIVEIQTLVVPAKGSLQRIYSDRIDSARVSRVAAILERHAGLVLSDQDIYVNVGGGMKLSEVSIELALAIALYSSKMDVPVPSDMAAFGELSLAGEVRPVSFADRRMKALADMGFGKALSVNSKSSSITRSLNVKDIKSALIAAFSKRN